MYNKSGRRSKCKGPEARAGLNCSRSSKGVRAAYEGDELRGVMVIQVMQGVSDHCKYSYSE